MINQKQKVKKQKVVNIYKDISYSGAIRQETILEESIKALEIVRRVEASGTRVNLFLVLGTEVTRQSVVFVLKLKSADERMNISKLAFPLVHPSMLRRLYFRLIEVAPCVKSRSYIGGYGSPIELNRIAEMMGKAKDVKDKKALYLPKIIGSVDQFVDELKKR